MKTGLSKIPVIVQFAGGIYERGMLEYTKSGPSIQINSGTQLLDMKEIKFRLDAANEPSSAYHQVATSPLKETDIVVLEPICSRIFGYSEDPVNQIEMYPPSSNDWISHVVDSGRRALYTLQNVQNKDRYLLTISDLDDNRILNSFLLHYYEIGILDLKRDWDVHQDLFFAQTPTPDLEKYLNRGPPKWSFMSELVEGVDIPNLRIMNTMGETMNQLVPTSFPPSIRKQLIAFLSWLETAEIPDQDPIEFDTRYTSVDTFRSLVWGHLMCLLEDVEPPSYVKIFTLADQGKLSLTERPLIEPELQNPWYPTREYLFSLFPDRLKRVLKFALSLNSSGQIIDKLPVSKEEALSSRESWGDRYSMIIQGLMLRGHVNKERIGLRTMVYIGGAHRWPHKHLEFSARLGYQSEKPQQIQVMTLPVTAVEKVTRMLPTIRPIGWEHSTMNLSLYNVEKRLWRMKTSLIRKSLKGSRSLSNLIGEFRTPRQKNHISISPRQAKVLDMLSWALYIDSLETGLYSDYFGISANDLHEEILELKKRGIVSLEYNVIPRKLTSIFMDVEGTSKIIYSFSRAMLKHAPSAAVRISENGRSCFVIARIPEENAYNFMTTIPEAGQDLDVSLKVLPISAYISYRNNLFSRLLDADGSWNYDVRGLLSQTRLRSGNRI